MKKIIFILYLVLISILIAFISKFDNEIIIYLYNYELITNIKFIFFILLGFLLINNLIFKIFFILLKTDKNYFLKENKKVQSRYDNYIQTITNSYVNLINNNYLLAEKDLIKANKILSNEDLTILLQMEIKNYQNKYKDIFNFLPNLKNKHLNKEYFENKLFLKEALKNNDNINIKLFANKILDLNKKDCFALLSLFNILKNDQEWSECKQILEIIKKNKYLDLKTIESEMKLIKFQLTDFNNNKKFNFKRFFNLKLK